MPDHASTLCASPTPVLLAAGLLLLCTLSAGACRGPDEADRHLELNVDPSLLARDWEEGPRRDAVKALVQREGRTFARRLFASDPMPSGMPREAPGTGELRRALLTAIDNGARAAGRDEPPSWWHGVEAQPDSYEHDLPREWVVQVQRGETMAMLARWSGQDAARIREDSREAIGKRRWLRPGDPLTITMSANQKLAFDQAREAFQSDRLDDYFAKHFIEKVVVYVVQRGDVMSKVARKYGKVPIWLLEEFNQMDFRALQPGDTILIPVVSQLGDGEDVPPELQVVDRDGRPLGAGTRGEVDDRMPTDLLRRARLAIDDSNVFERPASGGVAAEGLLPSPGSTPRRQRARSAKRAEGGAAEAGARAPRAVAVRSGETLSHFASWSGLSVDDIVEANPGLDPDRIAAGQRLELPLSDTAYARFVLARAGKERTTRQTAGGRGSTRLPDEPAPTPRRPPAARIAPGLDGAGQAVEIDRIHVVQRGETGGGIAARYEVSLEALGRANPDTELDRLYAGDRLAVPRR